MAKTITGVGILKTLKDKFSKKGVWVQGHYGLDKEGNSVDGNSTKAVKFCLIGGIQNVGKGNAKARKSAEALLIKTNTFVRSTEQNSWIDGVIDFNDDDSTTKAKVLKALDEAIKLGTKLVRKAAAAKGAKTKAAAKKASKTQQ